MAGLKAPPRGATLSGLAPAMTAAVTALPAPLRVRVVETNRDVITLAWDPPPGTEGLQGQLQYQVQFYLETVRADGTVHVRGGDRAYQPLETGAATTIMTRIRMDPHLLHCFRVRAIHAGVVSEPSDMLLYYTGSSPVGTPQHPPHELELVLAEALTYISFRLSHARTHAQNRPS